MNQDGQVSVLRARFQRFLAEKAATPVPERYLPAIVRELTNPDSETDHENAQQPAESNPVERLPFAS
jgi:hypothetical protein